ncbi:MAG: tripartite tricarboxylate transporter substrate binding protein [Burkholderiales bacterium]|nr:tripartite tricarboxylate transporter substrate binding protein [Burkholderiales bacterium]
MNKIAMTMMAALLPAVLSGVALAQSYPTKPVRLVVPFPPGGGVDATGRVLGQKLTSIWRQQVILDNRSGAGTTIGTEIAARAAADGYTLLLTNNALAISAGLYPKLGYDTGRDLMPVTEVLRQPFVLVVPASGPHKTLKDLIAEAKVKPGALALANTGIGSGPHLAGVLLSSMAGAQFNHIPYKGGGPAIQDLVGNRVHALITTALAAMPHVQGGRLRALGVTSGKRSPALPALPTLAEGGVPGYDVSTWYMLLAPAGTPKAVVAAVHEATVTGLRQPDAVKILASEGAEMVLGTPAEAAGLLKGELARWSKTIREANVRPEG